jgi:hypothetical protein
VAEQLAAIESLWGVRMWYTRRFNWLNLLSSEALVKQNDTPDFIRGE